MHRVELKGVLDFDCMGEGRVVPNAPCGVERLYRLLLTQEWRLVPNAPCGVERVLDEITGMFDLCS